MNVITSAERYGIIDAVCRSGYGEPIYPHERVLVSEMFDLMAKMSGVTVLHEADAESEENGANH